MAWYTPTLAALVTQAVRSFAAHMPGADAALRRNNIYPVAKVLAGIGHGIYGYADNIARGRFVLTCDGDLLDRHGAQMKPSVPRRMAVPARGTLVVTAPLTAQIFEDTIFIRSDGAVFTTDAGALLVAGVATPVAVTAAEAGSGGNTAAAAPFSTDAGTSGIVAEAGPDGLSGGADIEDHETYRHRLLFAKAFPEHAGALPDFVRYVSEIPGVTRVFIAPGFNGRATVGIYPLFDEVREGGLPTSGDLDRISAHLDEKKPGGVLSYVERAGEQTIDVTISGLAPDTPEVRLAVTEELRAMIARKGRVAGTATSHPSMPFLATPLTLPRSWFWEAVSGASGEENHIIAAPAAEVVINSGKVPVLGTVNFV